MGEFTKTIIIDGSEPPIEGERYQTIQAAIEDTDHNDLQTNGGTIIVEQDTYAITSSTDTVSIPDNVTLIGRGNVIIEVNGNYSAFKNADQTNGNSRITISGFKFIVAPSSGTYEKNLIQMKNVNNCVVENLYITVDQDTVGIEGVDTGTNAIYFGSSYDSEDTYTCTNNIVRHCIIEDYGRVVEGEENTYNYGVGITFAAAQVSNHPGQGNIHYTCYRNSIKNNIVKNAANGCYLMFVKDTVVKNNIFRDANYNGTINDRNSNLLVESCKNISVLGNQCLSATSHGIYISHSMQSSVVGNVSYNNNRAGMNHNGNEEDGYSNYNSTMGNVFNHNNRIGGTDVGIALYNYSQYNSFIGNICSDGNCRGFHDSDYTGENLNNLVVGNICHGNDNRSVYKKCDVVHNIDS